MAGAKEGLLLTIALSIELLSLGSGAALWLLRSDGDEARQEHAAELWTRHCSTVITMLTRIRRSAGLLLALFASHLTMVAGGAVCVVPGLKPLAGAVSADASRPMASMPGMGGTTAENAVDDPTVESMTEADASTDASPCSGPSSGSCTAAMPCITALGAEQGEPIALPFVVHGAVDTVALLMPASSVFAPDIPPPRA